MTPPIPAIAADVPATAARALARTRLAVLPTPLVAAPRLAEASNWPGAMTSRWRCRPAAAQQALALAQQVPALPRDGPGSRPCRCHRHRRARGPGCARPSPDDLASAEQAMRTEGLMMDPVYAAKALATAPWGASAVFWHTGGVLDAVAAEEGGL